MSPDIKMVVDYFRIPEFCLALSSALILLVGGVVSASGNLQGPPYILIGLMMLGSALISKGYLSLPRIDEILPILPVSGILGTLLFFSSIISFASGGGWWTTWVTFVASIFALYTAFLKLRRPPPLF